MLDIKFIRANVDAVREAIKNKKVNANLDHLLSLDDKRRELIVKTEDLRNSRNVIVDKMKNGKDEALISESKKLKESLGQLEVELKEIENAFAVEMQAIPNVPMPDVPVGADESENKILEKWGEVPSFKFKPRDHVGIGEVTGTIDIPRAAKISGTRFGFWTGKMVVLEMALWLYTMKLLTSEKVIMQLAEKIEKGYSPKPFIPVLPPVIIKPEVYVRNGRMTPQDKEEKYHLDQDDLYLIGSAEHSLVAMHMDEVIHEKDLPLRYLGYSTSFRREAGSYGKDTKGMLRVHQFDKMEMESFTKPEDSLKEHYLFVAIQEFLMQSLELPYQKVINCTGDMGKPNARQIDIETWFPSQGRYRETHSADHVTDFQSRGLNTKFKRANGAIEYVHNNDATAFSQRPLLAIMENCQLEDGTIVVPKVLRELAGFDAIEPVK
ncbi:MAG: serine--tRNA ligase [Acidobacteriaceae bacterium]